MNSSPEKPKNDSPARPAKGRTCGGGVEGREGREGGGGEAERKGRNNGEEREGGGKDRMR